MCAALLGGVAACGSDAGPAQTAPVYEVGFGPSALGDATAGDAGGDSAGNDSDGAGDGGGPDAPDLPRGTVPDGEACDTPGECQSGSCLAPEDGFPEGLCSPAPCGVDTLCSGSSETVCYLPTSGDAFCTRRCEGATDCRDGYGCEFIPALGFGACAPAPPPEDLPDGEACTEDTQCAGGTCLRPPEWPGGYCTTVGCETFADCSGQGQDNRCLIDQTGGENTCVRACATATDCRSRYACQPLTETEGFCAPDPNRPLDVDPDTSPLGFSCDVSSIDFTTRRLGFVIDDETTGYMVVPVALDGRRLQPLRLTLPGQGGELDFVSGLQSGQSATAQILGFTAPVIVPWLPELGDQLASGNHDFDLSTGSQSLCYYVLQETSPGTTLDLNLYFVGVPDLRAELAPGDVDLAAVLDGVDGILAPLGVAVGEVRYFDAADEVVDAFEVIRSEEDVAGLVRTSTAPGDTLDAQLSANVFWVQGFDMGGAIGISPGLPGPAGLHGTPGSGVVMTSEALRGGPDGIALTAQVMTHELGHYLGLWHTSELGGAGFDPLTDTPQCSDTSAIESCPDFTNLMFPIAGSNHSVLSEGQMFMLLRNPLTRD